MDSAHPFWPALLNREQLCAYLGDLADSTVRRICPVPAVDLGANVLRYRRADVDRWLQGLAERGLPAPPVEANDAGAAPEPQDRAAAALERMRARVGKR